MKRLFILSLLLCLLIPCANAQEAPLYKAQLRYKASIYQSPDSDKEIGYLKDRQRVSIYEVSPAWLKVGVEDKIVGYIKREKLDDYTAEPIDPSKTPAYPGVQNLYLGWMATDGPVRAQPGDQGECLITLSKGVRLAFIGIEDGWAKLIFKRQYGYVDTRLLSELQPVSLTGSDDDAPIAAYTSFYNIATTENNLSRIKNLEASCVKFEKLTIQPGGNFDFNRDLGPYRASNGYFPAIVLVAGGSQLGYGGGTCQASSTLYNAVLQLPGLTVDHRRPHGPGGASYLPHGADAAVGNETQNFKFSNHYPFPIRIEGTVKDGAFTVAIWKAKGGVTP